MNINATTNAADLASFDVDEADDTIVEAENKGDEELVKPWDPKKIRITTNNYTIRELYAQIIDNELDLAPDFQRSFVWDVKKQVRLIESILLGIPLPAFYFNQDELGNFQVIDGVQRLTTIKLFMSNEISLKEAHLEYLKDLMEHNYSSLDGSIKRRFAGTQIVAHVIEPQTPDEVKYDIFNRVNTGGSPLTAQEIRHCMGKDISRELLKTLVESDSFDQATQFAFWSKDKDGKKVRNNRRMADREMALRFCAFRTLSIQEYEKSNSLDGFLLEFTRQIDRGEVSKVQINDLKQAFNRSMRNCAEILDDAAFRRWPIDADRRGPINRAIFESQALALADHEFSEIKKHKATIKRKFRRLFEELSYDNAVRASTGDPRRVERRLARTKQVLKEIVDD
jgi:hypothetical protein